MNCSFVQRHASVQLAALVRDFPVIPDRDSSIVAMGFVPPAGFTQIAGKHASRQQVGNPNKLIGPGQRSDLAIRRHDRHINITKPSGPIRVGARVAINLELAVDKLMIQ